jgi:thioredoxin 2
VTDSSLRKRAGWEAVVGVGKDRNIKRHCKGCGGRHIGSPTELIDGGQCSSCKMYIQELAEPLTVNKDTLESIATVLKVPLLVEVQMSGSAEERAQEPHLTRVAERVASKAVVLKLDARDESDMAWALGVRAVPTLLVVRGMKVVHSYEGVVDAGLLEEWIRQAARL